MPDREQNGERRDEVAEAWAAVAIDVAKRRETEHDRKTPDLDTMGRLRRAA